MHSLCGTSAPGPMLMGFGGETYYRPLPNTSERTLHMTEPCPHCQGSGWCKPVEDTRNLLQRMTFVRCEKCDHGRLADTDADTVLKPR